MKQLARVVIFLAAFATVLAEEPRPFSATLSPADKQHLGLAALTPAQLAELDAAIAAYTRGEKTAAVQQAVAETDAKVQAIRQEAARQAEEKIAQAKQQAATAAVEDYKKKSEPGVIARTLDAFKRRQEEDTRVRFTAHVVGDFRGWSGGTYFPLTDGQVWRQTGTETYELPPLRDAEVEIYQSNNGYWRLKYAGAWITVKRMQ
jgi:hypothetical protein